MTEAEKEQARKDAERDAERWALLLLLLFRQQRGPDADGNRISWDKEFGVFRINEKRVPIKTIRLYLTRVEDRTAKQLARLTEDLEYGRITYDQWRSGFRRSISSGHILAAGLALGSISQAITNKGVLSSISIQLKYADEFGRAWQAGKAGTSAQVVARARHYADAIYHTYTDAEMDVQTAVGKTEAIRVRRAHESCRGCIRYSGRWMPIEKMPKIGSLECGRFCKCYIVFR